MGQLNGRPASRSYGAVRHRSAGLLVLLLAIAWPLSGIAQSSDPNDPNDPTGTDGTDSVTTTTTVGGKLPWDTFDERIKSSQSIAALGSDLLGDVVNLQNGALSFEVTDVSIPGNSSLSVAFTRRYEVINHKHHNGADGMLGDWNVVVPNISGSFAPDWISRGTNPGNRCSDQRPPPTPASDVQLEEFWHGLHLEIPGVGGGELLKYDPAIHAGTPMPADGNTYKWVTNDHVRIYCLPDGDIYTDNKSGEGFIAVTPDGTTYTFDHMAQYFEPAIVSVVLAHPTTTFTTPKDRRKNVLYVTNITDRFGNQVNFTYDNAEDQPGRLTRIEADDGRFLQVTYTSGLVSQVDDGTRTWTYSYATTPHGRKSLDNVTLPGGSVAWDLNFEALTDAEIDSKEWGELDRSCRLLDTPWNIEQQFSGTVIHPSGASGQFTVGIREHGRSNVPLACGHVTKPYNDPTDDINTFAISAYSLTLLEKEITGAGLGSLLWTYSYAPGVSVYRFGLDDSDPSNDVTFADPVCDWNVFDCASPPTCVQPGNTCSSAVITVEGPNSEWTRYSFGNSFRYNEGKLLSVQRGTSTSNILETVANTYDTSLADHGYPRSYGSSTQPSHDGDQNTFHRPLLSSSVTRQGETFTWEVLNSCPQGVCATEFAQPEKVMRYSTVESPSEPTGYGRTEETSYRNDLNTWVIGQVETLTCVSAVPNDDSCNNTTVSETGFDVVTSQPTWHKSFGKLQYTLGYHSRGMLHTYTDGGGKTTYLTGWYRGVPQQIDHPDITTPSGADQGIETAVVDYDGTIISVTDEVGAQTCYGYDDLGRLETITYPSALPGSPCSISPWNQTSISYTFGTSSYLTGGSHWQQIIQTGDSVKRVYLDAFQRAAVVHEHKSPSGGSRFSAFAYDHAGRTTFAAYPGSTWPLVTGVETVYDSLGRVSSVTQDAEPSHGGAVGTTWTYLPGFKTRVTNANGSATTTSFMALDQPVANLPVLIAHPEGVYTDIERDAHGKPLSITRGDHGTTDVMRHYIYNGNQELCKQVEPEAGITVSTFDGAGNLSWSASGQFGLNDVSCSDVATVPSADRVNRQYDDRNRLTDLAFSDGNGSQQWSYFDDGRPSSIRTWNNEGLSWVFNSYTYNQRRLLTAETQYQPDVGNSWSIAYGYDARGYLASHKYPDDSTVAYSPDHLGRATKVGEFATAASYHATGALAEFQYANGIMHAMTPNERQLPFSSEDYRLGDQVRVHHDVLTYDKNGNVTHIDDLSAGGDNDRSLTYDDLDRLLSAVWTAKPGVSQVYAYDALDNLTRIQRPHALSDNYYCYFDPGAGVSLNRLMRINDAPCSEPGTTIAFSYDDRGNVESKNGSGHMAAFIFDFGNRLRTSPGKEVYRYDAHGRRIQATDAVDADIFSVYGQDGVLRYQVDERRGEATSFYYLAGSLVARTRTALAAAGPVLSAGMVDTATGGYTLSWTPTGGSYSLEESIDGGDNWNPVVSTALTNWTANNKANGSYVYRVRGCDPGCTADSNRVTVTVLRKPTQKPTITNPTFDATKSHDFTVSWGAVAYASSYQLQQRYESSTWSTIHQAGATSKAVAVTSDGTYEYRVRACNDAVPAECGPFSALKLIEVGPNALEAPVLSAGTVDTATGGYTLSWTPTGGSYSLEESIDGGDNWNPVVSTTLTNWTANSKANGSYVYRVRGCDPGCTADSNQVTVTVLRKPTQKPTITNPTFDATESHHFTVSWGAVAYASSYQLQQRYESGTWSTIHQAGATSKAVAVTPDGTYEYQVRGCNDAVPVECGPFSDLKLIEVGPIAPEPPDVPGLTVPADDENGAYNVTWTSESGATEYNLQESPTEANDWALVYDGGTSLLLPVAGHGAGTFDYRIQACATPSVCSDWSTPKTIYLGPPLGKPTVSGPGISASGDYTIQGTVVHNATQYRLEERTNGAGTWAWIDTENWGMSHQLMDKAPADYEYRAKACNSFGCGPDSTAFLVEVGPPTASPTVSAPLISSTGDYTASWTTVPRGDTYQLQQSLNNGTWTAQAHSGTSKAFLDQPPGNYRYRARGCRGTCGPYSAIKLVEVGPPTDAPVISAPATSSGSYTVSWTPVDRATDYRLQQSFNSGTWSTVTVAGTSKAYSNMSSGSYRYRVRGRRGSVGPLSNIVTVVVTQPPTNPPSTPASLIVDYLGSTSCMAQWSASTGADRYELHRSGVEIYDGGNTQYWYKNACNAYYKVRACNAAGCSAFTAEVWPTPPSLINGGGDDE